jgi:hypothetical protein
LNTDPTSCYYYVCISTGGKASTPPDSDDDSNQHELDDDQPRDANDHPQFHNNDPIFPQNVVNDRPCPQTGRQKGMAAVMKVNPPDMIAKLTSGLKKTTLRIVEDVRSHYAVSAEEQPDGILSDELRVGMKRAAAAIPRSEFEIYSFSTRHNLSEAATDELLQLVSNVSIYLWQFVMHEEFLMK